MRSALIGHSGFVGGTLQRQRQFDERFRSTDVHQLAGRSYDLLVCAGAPAQKWLANRDPEADRASLARLMDALGAVRAARVVLVSTVDVFGAPADVDEASPVDEQDLHPYGRHRRELERFVAERFAAHLIVRLPGLVGPGLRKNAVFDLHHENQVAALDPRARFQFYPTVNLWSDLAQALALDLRLVHLSAAPLGLAEVARECFGRELAPRHGGTPASYDVRSRHAAAFGGHDGYAYDQRASLLAIRAYAQSEPRRAPREAPA